MSEANVETVRRALAALDQRDVEAYLEVASPEIELINPVSALEGPSVGHDGIRRFFDELEAHAETSSFEVEEVRAVGSKVLAFFTLTARARLSGAETSADVGSVYEFEDGKIRHAHVFADRDEAVKAAGAGES
jgi:ketosteroid isomerase-like protein